MMHTFNIKVANKPAALERLLRVTRHRGFALKSMNVTASDEQLMINLSVDSERPVHLLFNQLQKLYDVKNIEV